MTFQADVGGRKGPLTSQLRGPELRCGPGARATRAGPQPESLPPVRQETRPSLGVGVWVWSWGSGGQESGAHCCPTWVLLLSFLSPPDLLPTALWRPGEDTGPQFPHLGSGEQGGRARLLCVPQLTSPQLFTSTHCTHMCLQF